MLSVLISLVEPALWIVSMDTRSLDVAGMGEIARAFPGRGRVWRCVSWLRGVRVNVKSAGTLLGC